MRDILEFDFDAKSHMGRKPRNNEDYVAFHVPAKEKDRIEQGALFIIADGVGGAEAGEFASQYAAEKVIFEYYKHSTLPVSERLVTAIHQANRDIFTHALDNAPEGGMATTLVAALLVKNKLYVANVGDSRAYLLTNAGIRQISNDHNLVGEMVSSGVMSEAAARSLTVKNQLTRSIGGGLDVKVDLFGPLPIQQGDRILLCTDGLTRYTTEGDLIGLAGSDKLEDDVIKLVSFAIDSGGEDNVSLILIEAVEKATHTLKKPIKHIGRSEVFKLRLGASGPLTPSSMPETKLGGGVTIGKKGTSWVMILVAGLAAVSILGWFIWNTFQKSPGSPVNIPLSTLPSTALVPSSTTTLDASVPVAMAEYIPEDIRAIDVSPNGSLVVVGTDHTGISLVNLKKRLVFLNIPSMGITGVAFIDDQTFIFSSRNGSIHVRGGKAWTELISMQNLATSINAFAYSSDAGRLAIASEDQIISIWIPIRDPDNLKLAGFTKLNDLPHNSTLVSMAFSPDGSKLLAGFVDGSVMEWDLGSNEGKTALASLNSPVTIVAYSNEGKCIAAGSMKGEVRTVCRNQGVIGGENTITVHTNAITGLAFSPVVADYFVSGSADETFKLWRNYFELDVNVSQGSAIDRLAFTPDGKHLIVAWSNNGVNTLTIWTIPYQITETPVIFPLLTATPTRTPPPEEVVPAPPEPTMITP